MCAYTDKVKIGAILLLKYFIQEAVVMNDACMSPLLLFIVGPLLLFIVMNNNKGLMHASFITTAS